MLVERTLLPSGVMIIIILTEKTLATPWVMILFNLRKSRNIRIMMMCLGGCHYKKLKIIRFCSDWVHKIINIKKLTFYHLKKIRGGERFKIDSIIWVKYLRCTLRNKNYLPNEFRKSLYLKPPTKKWQQFWRVPHADKIPYVRRGLNPWLQ